METSPAEQTHVSAEKSRIMIIGSTGYIGRHIVEASAAAKNYTLALVRTMPTDPNSANALLIEKFKTLGVHIVYGDFNIHREIIVNAMKQVDVVISCVGDQQVPDQVNIISAINEAGNIKKFYPSEFVIDVDRLHDPVEPAAGLFAGKAVIRRLIESHGIPHTFVVSHCFAGGILNCLAQVLPPSPIPHIETVDAYGDGNSTIIATAEEDLATYVIKSVDDPRTMNKILYMRPPANILTFNQLFSLWETMSGKTLQRTYYSEDKLLQKIPTLEFPADWFLAILYSLAIKNDCANYEIEPSFGVEASELYPEVKYKTVSQFFSDVLAK